MYQLNINDLTPAQFLKEYWQKKPLLIKSGFTDFQDPLTAEELAGLAVEECVESRIITNADGKWQAHHGPFDDFSLLTPTHSTLLVQAVDHWHPEAAKLLEPFRFIPNWRIDDLMVSFSTPEGGVGPHLDQYDVFIIQGEGKRHWRVGMPDDALEEKIPCKDLLQITEFEACIDSILMPGDILYIPPGCPHEGYAVENAINYSVGFRAPNQTELLSSFSDHLIDNELGKKRYSDPLLTLRENCGELTQSEQENIRQLLIEKLHDKNTFNRWLGESLSQAKHDLDIAEPEYEYTEQVIIDELTEDVMLHRIGGLRSFYQKENEHIIVSINGNNDIFPHSCMPWITLLCNHTQVTSDQLKSSIKCSHFIQFITKLINEGYWYFE